MLPLTRDWSTGGRSGSAVVGSPRHLRKYDATAPGDDFLATEVDLEGSLPVVVRVVGFLVCGDGEERRVLKCLTPTPLGGIEVAADSGATWLPTARHPQRRPTRSNVVYCNMEWKTESTTMKGVRKVHGAAAQSTRQVSHTHAHAECDAHVYSF